MSIPTIEYRGYELRAYSRQEFPLHRDPYAKGPRQFSSIVTIDPIPPTGVKAARYSTVFGTASPTNTDDAVDLAMRYGKDIIDGKVQATEL
jgi:hypothetical protein